MSAVLGSLLKAGAQKGPGAGCSRRREWQRQHRGGLSPRPGTAEVYVFPGARDGRLIADVVRLDKGHTEGLEPHITETLISMMAQAPGGKAKRAAR